MPDQREERARLMEQIAVVTDSSADLPASLAEAHDIYIVPQIMVIDDERLIEGKDFSREEVYDRLRNNLPVRAGHPTPDDFRVLFRKMAAEVTGIVVVAPSTLFNPTLVSASVAAVTYGKLPAEAINTHLISAGVGLVALAAAERAREAATLKEVAEAANDAISHVHLAFLSGDLRHLRQAGHISALTYRLQGVLGRRALLTVERGLLHVADFPAAARSIPYLVEWLQARVPSRVTRAIVVHADAASEAHLLKEAIEKTFAPDEVFVSTLTPMLAVRSGPGTVGVALYAPQHDGQPPSCLYH